jgi:hypothetical protein
LVAESHRAGEVDSGRRTEEKRVSRFVHGFEAGEGRCLDEASHTSLRFDDGDTHVGTKRQQLMGARESGDPCADDHDVGVGPQRGTQ